MACPTAVLTGPEERLLTALAGIEVDRNLRRDFPEELSMPSVARRLGVVRSALHNPISSLESKGLLDSIKSNVIGAPRKKTVLLITKKGLEVASNFGLIEKQTTKLNQILGRDEEIEAICRALESPGIVVLTGLPGIGKSSVAKAVCSKLEQEKKKVGWHTGSRMTSTSSLIESWTDIPVSENFDELGDGFDPNMVYILDEAQEIHRRHADNIRRVLENARHAKILVVTRSPSTFSSLSETLKITLEGLEIEVAARIADHLTEEQATQVAIALDGHPLAIQMWRDGDDVPIPGTPVADFISSTVLDRLDTNTAQELEDLTLEPFPISRGDSITDLSIDNLDDATILKWSGSRFESQHLIKHVKLASLDEDKVKSIHERLVDRWSEIEGFEARGHEMHHRILSGQSVSKGLAEDVFDNLGPVVASTLLSDALDNEERGDLRILSARAAIAIGEAKMALRISEGLTEQADRLKIEMESFRLLGKESRFLAAEEELLSKLGEPERSQVLIRGAVRLHDDRLPGPISRDLGDEIIQRLDRIEVQVDQLDASLLASDLILRYLVASNLGDAVKAAALRSEIVGLIGEGHRRLEEIDLRLKLKSLSDVNSEDLEKKLRKIEEKHEKLRIIHWIFAAAGELSPTWAIDTHKSIFLQDNPPIRREHARIEAFSWYWRGFYDRDQRLRYWSEAAARLRLIGCSNASMKLIERIYHEVRSQRQ